MSIKVTVALAAAIVLSSTVMAAAQVPPGYYDYDPAYSYRSPGAPPSPSDFPAAAGGGSPGYNQSIRQDW